jgi:4-aminobutyrate aminotransferase-like enzyme
MHGYNPNGSSTIAMKGEGSWFTDQNGNKFLDGVSGLWCLNLGHGRKEIVDAASEQMMQMSYFPLTFSHVSAIKLSAKISELLGGLTQPFSQTAVLKPMKPHSRLRDNTTNKTAIRENISLFPDIARITVQHLEL